MIQVYPNVNAYGAEIACSDKYCCKIARLLSANHARNQMAPVAERRRATTHSFRKPVATLIDDEGLSARIGADHLGHSKVSMTQDRYTTRGRIHTQVADLLDRTIAKSGE
jgi:integrase